LKQSLKVVILGIEAAEILSEIPNIKKLKGFSTAYRIRINDYRLGLYYNNGVIEIARLVKRNDIYKVFP
jgi:mRNA-degrading endonuclease RelE of RelBE toxin-antitoxin system